MEVMKSRVLSGAQPTSETMHLGNYIGALTNWAKMQEDYDAFFFVPDLHSISMPPYPKDLANTTRLTAAQYIAAGIDPEEATLFIQSHVPAHAELAWVLNCLAGYGEAARMTQFKDKSKKGGAEKSSVGLLAYPMLMAADILLYKPNYVPVGEDQRQHLELTRNLAQRFNKQFGEVFKVPEAFITKEVAKIMDLQNPTAKMSKSTQSAAGLVNIMDTDKKTAKKIRSAVTDTGTEVFYDPENKPGISNLMTIYSALTCKTNEEIANEYADQGYGHFKVALADIVVETLGPIRERTIELMNDKAELDRILAHGAEKASELADQTLTEVYDHIGFLKANHAK
ncbi:MAG: tryptophan--tRNA ligase [Micrococcaceae bacterium]